MAKLVEARDVEQVIRRYLEGKGCTLSPRKKRGQTGADITARYDKSTWFVEVIGFQSHPPIRSREFYEAFFRVVSRDRGNPDDTLIVGLPKRFRDGMRQRKQQYPVAWEKLGKAFPNLRLWYVDTEQNTLEEYPWSNPFD
ncbi:MAG: hypothetical protein OEW82_00555 [Dehalococcoidia bacterium]|nr:hypothetical protein [Dehalococcoidia bacterium]